MKQRMQGILIGIILTTVLLSGVTALAASTRTIEVNFGNYRIYHFAQLLTVRDAEGEVLVPFSYNGNLYLPAQAVLRAMGTNASWDEATGVFRFGSVAPPSVNRTPLQTAAPFFDSGRTGSHISRDTRGGDIQTPNTRDSIQMGGADFYNAIVYRSSQQAPAGSRVENGVFTLHNLNRQYSVFSGYMGRVDGSSMYDATIEIRGDGRLIETFHLRATDMPIPFSVSVRDISQLRIDVVFPRQISPRVTYALVAYLE